ncbi:uncharacterized protein VTP21DRAFT_10680 [Calcarisporiella thermophila]|uniref:uncharacterized protein n=1 Tax=Calcarisporiella thermophila TaxID=911321 RepID=UPI003743C090
MIEVDVFWSFAFGASFAAAAAAELKQADEPWVNHVFVKTLLFLSLIFGPSGIYLLWDFPGWESMFVLGDKNTIPAILPTLFSFTNVLLGILGHYITWRMIKSSKNIGQDLSYHRPWIWAYACFNAILGMGYYRFTYAGTHEDWAAGRTFPMLAFFTSPVFFTLLAMGVVFVPAMVILTVQYARVTLRAHPKIAYRFVPFFIREVIVSSSVIVAGWFAYMFGLKSEREREYFVHEPVGIYAPLVGFGVFIVAIYGLVLLPFAYVALLEQFTAPKEKTK